MPKPADVNFYKEYDCQEVIAEMPENSVHMILTDPPYFLDSLKSDGEWPKPANINTSHVVGKLPAGMKFDPELGIQLHSYIKKIAVDWLRVCRPGAFVLCFSQPRLTHRMAMGLEEAGFEIRDVYTWHYTKRTQMKAFSMSHFINRKRWDEKSKDIAREKLKGKKTAQVKPLGEHIILAQKPCDSTLVDNVLHWGVGLMNSMTSLNGQVPHSVMWVEKDVYSFALEEGWVTPKPLKLLSHLVNLFTDKGQLVLDPFGGSGSTAIAAAKEGRQSVIIELDREIANIATRRFMDETLDWRLCFLDEIQGPRPLHRLYSNEPAL